ncbi:Putative N-acetyl-LL-diaminopimelate aminotransferase [Poriferisphaera corsica]|uniref:Aminotransferase n=2 Tax=Poriferisphaera corsica TaxID=2528020 RepID=A0A517YV41_9BACT|nr:Putative N-acetyl-LL-diaminopimelate aminotransferase [Poriferisphaera corsica]
MFNPESFITDKLHAIDASGIRRVFDLAANLKNPINLSIGQPDFDVPDTIKQAAIKAINDGKNSYTQTQGMADLRERVMNQLISEFPQTYANAQGTFNNDDLGLLITSGVSGALMLALLTTISPGDEVLIPDPYFVMYKHLVTLAGGTPVFVDTYPDFQLTPDRIEKHITPKTKVLLFNTPSNPTGVVAKPEVCKAVVKLCEDKNILMLSDEIYDEFCYEKTPSDHDGKDRCPSPAAYSPNLIMMRGYSKTYAMTGWRLGYAVGPKAVLDQMTKLQQYSFVCAPSMTQFGGVIAHDLDMSDFVAAYKRKRDMVVDKLAGTFELTTPGGAFYAFPKVPESLNLTGAEFVEKIIAKNCLVIPGNVFSQKDTHFRISYACADDKLEQGLDILVQTANECAAAK